MSKVLNILFCICLLVLSGISSSNAKKLTSKFHNKLHSSTKSLCSDALSDSNIVSICKACQSTSYYLLSLATWASDYPNYGNFQTKFSNLFSSADIYLAENYEKYEACVYITNAVRKSTANLVSSLEGIFNIELDSEFKIPGPLLFGEDFELQSLTANYSSNTLNSFLSNFVLKSSKTVTISSAGDSIKDLFIVYYNQSKVVLKGSIVLTNFNNPLSFETQLYNINNQMYWKAKIDRESYKYYNLDQYLTSLASTSSTSVFSDYQYSVCDSFDVVFKSNNEQLSIAQATMDFPKKDYNLKLFENFFTLNYIQSLVDFGPMDSKTGSVILRGPSNFKFQNTIFEGVSTISKLTGVKTTANVETASISPLLSKVFGGTTYVYETIKVSEIPEVKEANIKFVYVSNTNTSLRIKGKFSWYSSSNEDLDLTVTQFSSYTGAAVLSLPYTKGASLLENIISGTNIDKVLQDFNADKLYVSCSLKYIDFDLFYGMKPDKLASEFNGKGTYLFGSVSLTSDTSRISSFRKLFTSTGSSFQFNLTLSKSSYVGGVTIPDLDLGKNLLISSSQIIISSPSTSNSDVSNSLSGKLSLSLFGFSATFTIKCRYANSPLIIYATNTDRLNSGRFYMSSPSLVFKYTESLAYHSGSAVVTYGPSACFYNNQYVSNNNYCLQGTASIFIDLDNASNSYLTSTVSVKSWDHIIRTFIGSKIVTYFSDFFSYGYIASLIDWTTSTLSFNYALSTITTTSGVLPSGFSISGSTTFYNYPAIINITYTDSTLDAHFFVQSMSFENMLVLKGNTTDGYLDWKIFLQSTPNAVNTLSLHGNATLFGLSQNVNITFNIDEYLFNRCFLNFSVYGGLSTSGLEAKIKVAIKHFYADYKGTIVNITGNVSGTVFQSLKSNVAALIEANLTSVKAEVENAYNDYLTLNSSLSLKEYENYSSCKSNSNTFCQYYYCSLYDCERYERDCAVWGWECSKFESGSCKEYKKICSSYKDTYTCVKNGTICQVPTVLTLNETCVTECNSLISKYETLYSKVSIALSNSQSINQTYTKVYKFASKYLGNTFGKIPFNIEYVNSDQIFWSAGGYSFNEQQYGFSYKVKTYGFVMTSQADLNLTSLDSISSFFYNTSMTYVTKTWNGS